jgi:hypothetical protein
VKKILWILIPLILSLSICACKKKSNDPIKITGKVLNHNSGNTVPGAKIVYYASKISGGSIYSSGFSKIVETSTDESGTFSCEIPEDKYAEFKVEVTKEKYFKYTLQFPTSDFDASITNTPTYNIYSEAILRINIVNISPYDTNDYVSVNINASDGGGENCCSGTQIEAEGMDVDQTFYCKTYGNQQVNVTYTTIKNNIQEVHNINRFCPEFDTTGIGVAY